MESQTTKKIIEHDSGGYYDISEINKYHCLYNMIIGQRSNGKTYAVCRQILEHYIKTGEPSAYIRRLDEQIKPANIQNLFNPFEISELTDGRFNGVRYYQRQFRFVSYDENGQIVRRDKDPFCYALSVNTADTTKGQDRGFIKYIVFDEFLTRSFYLANEYIMFQNLISSLTRDRTGTIIYMLANTVNKSSIYFEEFGIHNISKIKQGTIEIYKYGKSGVKLALEYCAEFKSKKKANQYFAFDNPRLEMITKGAWELDDYPHAPAGLNQMQPLLIFYIDCQGLGGTAQFLQANLYCRNSNPFIFLHYMTKDIPEPDKKIIYTPAIDVNILHQQTFDVCTIPAMQTIKGCITSKKLFYSTNEVGELFRNFVASSKKVRSQM